VPAAHRRKSLVNSLWLVFWRVIGQFEYRVMDVRLRIADAICGPEPETEADRQRNRDRQRLERALKGSHLSGRQEGSGSSR
jgi:hypothetical protein